MFTTANTRFTFTFLAVALLYTLAVFSMCVSAAPLPLPAGAPAAGLSAPLALAQGGSSSSSSSPLALLTGSESNDNLASTPESKASSPLNLLGNLDSLPISQLTETAASHGGSGSGAQGSATGSGSHENTNASPLSLLGRRAYYARPVAPENVVGLVGPRVPVGLGPRAGEGEGEMMKREERFKLRMMRRASLAASASA